MIQLFGDDIRLENRQSSKGNQLKFERDGVWYKADYCGYEGLAEYVISKLLSFSTLSVEEYVDYDLEQIEYKGNVFNGCKSRDFTNGWQLITLERLFKQSYGYGLNQVIYKIPEKTERLKKLVEETERLTGISEFGKYMNKILTVDALFLNEDRHTHNLAVLTHNLADFKLAPIFDNGAGVLSDTTMDYPLGNDIIRMIDSVRAKTFFESFEEQMDISERLYGENIRFSFGYSDVRNIVDEAEIYSEEIRERVVDVIMQIRRRYEYLFK